MLPHLPKKELSSNVKRWCIKLNGS